MPETFNSIQLEIKHNPKRWLITGVAGFIGSNLLEFLLKLNQQVVGLDNFATGYQSNLDEVRLKTTEAQWANFEFYEGSICDLETCNAVCNNIDYVLHQAALGSVPRSIANPIASNATNISGFLNMLVAARDAKVKSFTYASSSSVYGDHPALPKLEDNIGKPLSPYSLTKRVNEQYADVFAHTYGFKTTGLRYFNVFGPRQNRNGAYAAVIPKWISSIIAGEDVFINGDGETSRDFCYITNAIQANVLAATNHNDLTTNQIYNVALNDRTSLNVLFNYIKESLGVLGVVYLKNPEYLDFRTGDVRHSQADISKISNNLGYKPTHTIKNGIIETVSWYLKNIKEMSLTT